MKNNTTAPVEKERETNEFDTSRHIVEENIYLKRENKELKERLDFTEQIIIVSQLDKCLKFAANSLHSNAAKVFIPQKMQKKQNSKTHHLE